MKGKAQALEEELMPTLHKYFKNIENERVHPNLFFEVNIIPILKSDKDTGR